jgi:hypothetical protein
VSPRLGNEYGDEDEDEDEDGAEKKNAPGGLLTGALDPLVDWSELAPTWVPPDLWGFGASLVEPSRLLVYKARDFTRTGWS